MNKNDHLETKHRYCLMWGCGFWIFHLFVLSVVVYVFGMFIMAHNQTHAVYNTSHYNYAVEAIQMWEKGYIIDIKVVNTDNCPEGYQPLIDYTWSGTDQGCYCKASMSDYDLEYVLEGTCTSELIYYGCSTISPMGKQQMKMWKGGKLLCYKRASSLNFYNSTLDVTPDGTELVHCAEDRQYQVNTLPNVSCPINDISNRSFGNSQTTLNLDTEHSLYYVSGQGYPIADFKLTEYEFCPYFEEINISPNKEGNYILQIENYSTTCTENDPRMQEFDFLTQEDFYTNNTRIYDVISSLPGYPRPSDEYVYRLGYVGYPAWTQDCRSTRSHSLLEATDRLMFSRTTDRLAVCLYISIPCLVLMAFIFRSYYIFRHIFELKAKSQFNMLLMTDQEVSDQLPNINMVKSYCKEVVLFIIELILIVAVMFSIVWLLMGLYQESWWIKETFTKHCTDNHLSGILYSYEVVIDEVIDMFGVVTFMALLLLISHITYFVLRVKVGDLQEQEEEVSSAKESAEQLNREQMFDKQLRDDHLQIQDSSDIVLRKERDEEVKVFELDNYMSNELGGAQETKFNFYGSVSLEQTQDNVPKKKKKKKGKRKNLFKQDDNDPI